MWCRRGKARGGGAHQLLHTCCVLVRPLGLDAVSAAEAALEVLAHAEGAQPAGRHDADRARKRVGLVHVVRGEQDNAATHRGEHAVPDEAARAHVDARGRLVEEDDVGAAARERDRRGELAARAARELLAHLVRVLDHAWADRAEIDGGRGERGESEARLAP